MIDHGILNTIIITEFNKEDENTDTKDIAIDNETKEFITNFVDKYYEIVRKMDEASKDKTLSGEDKAVEYGKLMELFVSKNKNCLLYCHLKAVANNFTDETEHTLIEDVFKLRMYADIF